MVEAKLRVEVMSVRNNTSSFGNTLVKKVKEEIFMHDFDKRKNIAPCGLIATIVVGNRVFDIKINRYYFDSESIGSYIAFFEIEEKVYEVYIKFDNENKIEDLWLSEWLQERCFEDGDNADNIYKIEDFTNIETLL